MDPEQSSPQQDRERLLTGVLSVLLGSFFLLTLIIITGGFVLYVLLVGGGMALFAWLHYGLWGRLLDEQVAGEREEQQLREQAHADDWPIPEPRQRQH
jgi:hypothetical protein